MVDLSDLFAVHETDLYREGAEELKQLHPPMADFLNEYLCQEIFVDGLVVGIFASLFQEDAGVCVQICP